MIEKQLEFVFSIKIKAIALYEQLNIVTVGFHDGKIENFSLTIESDSKKGADSSKYGDSSSNMNLLMTKTFQ